jgi:hypothetical protein
MGISNDELAILRWIVDFKDSGAMKKEYDPIEQKMYYWIVYTKIIEDLPIITLGSDTLESKKKKLQRLLNGNLSKIIDKKIKRDQCGTYLYVSINEENYANLVSNSTGQKCPEGWTNMSIGAGQKCPNKDKSISNSSINNKNKKETEIDKLINIYTNNEEFKNSIYEFIKMRKGIKAAITTYGLKRILNQLDKFAINDSDKIKILDNSIMKSWKGVFALKEDKTNTQSTPNVNKQYDAFQFDD